MSRRRIPRSRSLLPASGYVWVVSFTVLIAAILRFWRLDTLPPGLATGEAQIGLAAFQLSHHGIWPTFNASGDQSPLLVVLESVSQQLFGLAPWILRLIPALFGTIAVLVTYLWGKSWFGPRNGLIAAVLLATSAWGISLSRSIQPAALVALLLPLCLLLATNLWHKRTWSSLLAFIGTVGLTAYAGIVGWAVLAVVIVVGSGAMLVQSRPRPSSSLMTVWVTAATLTLVPTAILALIYRPQLGLGPLNGLGGQAVSVAQAFLFHGDESYRLNLGGQPLLNVFVGIMATAGIFVVATRIKVRRYRFLALVSVLSVVPAILSVGPNASAGRLSLAIVPAVMLASIGIGYMLEIWYTTFPINSAARLTGQSVIIGLLVLSAFQGYTQYFTAWASSEPTQTVFNAHAFAIGEWALSQPTSSSLVLITDPTTLPTLDYLLLTNSHPTTVITDARLIAPRVEARPLRLAADVAFRDALVMALKLHAPGSTLRTHVSSYDQSELYYTYELP